MNANELSIVHLDSATREEIAAEFNSLQENKRIYFQSPDITLVNHSEAWLSFSLPVAMRKGIMLDIQEPVSQRFLESLSTFQDIYSAWFPATRRVEIRTASPIQRAPLPQGRVGCFFSGGVDSWYTFLKHRQEITDLIFVQGFDIRLDNIIMHQQARAMIEQVAAHFNKRVVEVKTNLRILTDGQLSWPMVYGAALASVGHALSDHFRKIYIASTTTYANLTPEGSHPLLDPLWGTEALEFVHDGCESTRLAKLELLAGFDIALKTLRVCWKNPGNSYNCGKCEKCLRTMIGLQAIGALERCTTFDIPLDLRRVARMPIPRDEVIHRYRYYAENLHALEGHPEHRRLASALRRPRTRSRWELPLRQSLATFRRRLRTDHPTLYKTIKLLSKHI